LRTLFCICLLGLILVVAPGAIWADTAAPDLLQLFPDRVGAFRRVTIPKSPDAALNLQAFLNPSYQLAGQVEYIGGDQRLLVEMVRFPQDAEAYSLLTLIAAASRTGQTGIEVGKDYGTAGFTAGHQIVFFKGPHFVRITYPDKSAGEDIFAKELSESLDKGEGDIPALIKHLPNPEQSQKTAIFLPRFKSLQSLLPSQSVLTAIETNGDGDAAFVDSGSGKVLIIEFNTPQLAKENDERIIEKIHTLWNLGQPAPIGYRRVGNYSVFVFDTPDDATAKQLIDQVKYEQVVQWLGENPNLLKEAQKRYVETTLGVFIAVIKASGFALIGCLGLGGLIGALLFTRRRAQQTTREAFSDAGGMLRLNLDELTPQTDPARLLGPGR
jgi:hypothetical protein